jgi:hypothetical protein
LRIAYVPSGFRAFDPDSFRGRSGTLAHAAVPGKCDGERVLRGRHPRDADRLGDRLPIAVAVFVGGRM